MSAEVDMGELFSLMKIPKGWHKLRNGSIYKGTDKVWCSLCKKWHFRKDGFAIPLPEIYIRKDKKK